MCFVISTLERELEELEASALAAEAEDQRMRELCGEYSGEHHDGHDDDGHDDDDDGDDHEDGEDDIRLTLVREEFAKDISVE